MTNFRLHNEQIGNGSKKIVWAPVFRLQRQHIFKYIQKIAVSLFRLQQTNGSCHFPLVPFPQIHTVQLHYIDIYKENETNRKWQLPFVCCKQKTEITNFNMYPAKENGKQKLVFLGGKRLLLFQQKCPSMLVIRKNNN